MVCNNPLYIDDVSQAASLNLEWEKFTGKSFLISGASGLIGSFLADVLMLRNAKYNQHMKIHALGRNLESAKRFSSYVGDNNFIFTACDINSTIDFDGQYDFVIHLASNTHPLAYSSDPVGTITANIIGLNVGMFYKRRDYSRIVDGRNPIVAHEYLGTDLSGKDAIIIDDMISSGDSALDVAEELKRRNANRIFLATTFGLFTNGLEKFDKAFEDGLLYRVLTTNLVYQTPELLSRPWYINVDMSKYIAYLIDTLNHDASISDLLNPSARIQNILKKYGQV